MILGASGANLGPMLNVPIDTRQPQCPDCAHNITVRQIVSGKAQDSPGCWHHVSSYPKATYCIYFKPRDR